MRKNILIFTSWSLLLSFAFFTITVLAQPQRNRSVNQKVTTTTPPEISIRNSELNQNLVDLKHEPASLSCHLRRSNEETRDLDGLY